MIINIIQEKTDSKNQYLNLVELLEDLGYQIFDIGCYDKTNKLSEVVLVKNKSKLEVVDGTQKSSN